MTPLTLIVCFGSTGLAKLPLMSPADLVIVNVSLLVSATELVRAILSLAEIVMPLVMVNSRLPPSRIAVGSAGNVWLGR